jgi:hypothetical protein
MHPSEPGEERLVGGRRNDHRHLLLRHAEPAQIACDREAGSFVAGDGDERDPQPGVLPRGLELQVASAEVQRRDVRRADREGVLSSVQRIVAEVVHQQERGVLGPGGDAVRPVLRADHELFVLRLVGLVHAYQERDEDRHEQHHDPGASRELHDRDHDRNDEGRDRAQTVHEQIELQTIPAAEVRGHTGLRQGNDVNTPRA